MFIEEVKTIDGRDQYFDAKEQTYKDLEETEEVLKVRGGEDVVLKFQHTPNGVIIPDDFLEGKAEGASNYVPREVLPRPEL